MYSLSQSKGTTKLLLQSGRQDYEPNDNPTFVLNEVVQAPPFPFGLIGVEKMYWRQPPLFPSAYMTCTMTSIPLTGTSVAQTLTPTAASFTQSVTMNGVTMLMNLADTYYDGSGGEYLARLRECFRLCLNTLVNVLLAGTSGTYTIDFSSPTFPSWNALSSTTSTSVSLSKMDAATNWMHNNYKGLNLVLTGTTGDIMGVTFTDIIPNNAYL